MEFPFPREVAVDEIGDAGVGEETKCPGVVVVEKEIGRGWRGEEPGYCQEVGEVVDVFVRVDVFQGGADGCADGFGGFCGGGEGLRDRFGERFC